MGRKKGETVEVAAPRGKLKFKIMDIKAAKPRSMFERFTPRARQVSCSRRTMHAS